jgi:hypothetical protein
MGDPSHTGRLILSIGSLNWLKAEGASQQTRVRLHPARIASGSEARFAPQSTFRLQLFFELFRTLQDLATKSRVGITLQAGLGIVKKMFGFRG